MTSGIVLILRAAAFAAERHRGQARKGPEAAPFINHPIEVARVLAEEGGIRDPELIAAALLHDTIEDTPTVYDDLEERFGRRVATLVAQLTDDKRLPKKKRKREQVRHAGRISRDAKHVKLADKLCNLWEMIASPPANWSLARRSEYFEWSKRVVNRMRGVNRSLERRFDETYLTRRSSRAA
jgi:guanosine-3',5'-bis(diphosphate) 3'-pyrophosphohydrolase